MSSRHLSNRSRDSISLHKPGALKDMLIDTMPVVEKSIDSICAKAADRLYEKYIVKKSKVYTNIGFMLQGADTCHFAHVPGDKGFGDIP